MKLFKNVDICDVQRILQNGIQPISATGNNNWEENFRAPNSIDVVYLFGGVENGTSFTEYGAALVEVDVENADVKINDIDARDFHFGKYKEYTAKKVCPENIVRVLVPKIFKNKIPKEMQNGITWCEMKASAYQGSIERGERAKKPCSPEWLERFAETAPVVSSKEWNFFRGTEENGEIMDVYDVKYLI